MHLGYSMHKHTFIALRQSYQKAITKVRENNHLTTNLLSEHLDISIRYVDAINLDLYLERPNLLLSRL